MDTKPTVLVTGASGLLGRGIMRTLKSRNWNTVALAYSRASESMIKCDLTNPEDITGVINKYKPDYIVHAAAERSPDKVENEFEQTKKLNITSCETIALAAKSIGCKVIYISTDYVFDGVSPPFAHNTAPNPLNCYGQTKLDGELATLQAYKEGSCILRIPVLYGPVEYLRESAITCLFDLLLSTQPASVSHFEKRYPCLTDDIGKIICDLIIAMSKDSSLCGIFQWSGLERLTKYEMIVSMAEGFGLDYSHITPDTKATPGAMRPYDAQMENCRLEALGISHHSTFIDSIKEVLLPWKTK